MYSWDEDTSTWYGKGKYKYGAAGASRRKAAADRAKVSVPVRMRKSVKLMKKSSIPASISALNQTTRSSSPLM